MGARSGRSLYIVGHMMPIVNDGVVGFLADTKACTLIGFPFRVVAFALALPETKPASALDAPTFWLGVAIFISITSLVPDSLSKPGQGNGKRETTNLISCPSCSPDSLLPSTTCRDSSPSFATHHQTHLGLLGVPLRSVCEPHHPTPVPHSLWSLSPAK
jgi:hypothetical protein